MGLCKEYNLTLEGVRLICAGLTNDVEGVLKFN